MSVAEVVEFELVALELGLSVLFVDEGLVSGSPEAVLPE